MLKKLAVLFAVLALVAAACASSGDDDDATTTTAAGDTTETTAPADGGGGDTGGGDTGQASGATLDEVKTRGKLICGIGGSAIGFSETQADGSATGFDADYCRAVAAAVLGDANAVEYRALTAAERFEALKNGEIDVLIRNSTWTQSRDADIGVQFTATTYYDGQQMMVSPGGPAGFANITPTSTVADIDGATVCVNAGTTTEKNITEAAQVANITITLETTETTSEAQEKFKAGACDVYTTDGSGLFGLRSAEDQAGTEGAAEWVIFPTAPISKEPLGPVVRQNDDAWFDIVQWTVFATFIADEQGVTSVNFGDMMDNTPELTRLFGGEGEIQTKMGLPADAFAQVIKQVGNYGEIYEKNLTTPLGLAREGSFN